MSGPAPLPPRPPAAFRGDDRSVRGPVGPPSPSEFVLARAASGVRTTLASQGIRVACKAAAVPIVARLVSPAEHGIYAMAGALLAVVTLTRDLGLGVAAVHAPTLSEGQKSALWRIHVGLGALLAGLTVAIAPLAAGFFREPQVGPLLTGLSISLVLLGLNAWPRVLLVRELRFGDNNRTETIAAVLGTLAMLTAAALGAGAWTFLVFLLVSDSAILVRSWRVCAWRPAAPPDWAALRPLLPHGLHVVGHQFLAYLVQQVDALAVGRWFGARPMGLYSRPAQLLALPAAHASAPLANVLLASLARLRDQPAEFVRHFRASTALMAHLTLPPAVVCFVLPEFVVRLVLGNDWHEAVPVLRWMAATAGISALSASCYALNVATGHTRRLAAQSGVLLILVLLGVWIGQDHGIAGVAAGVATANAAYLLPRLCWSARGTPVRGHDLVAALRGPLGLNGVLAMGLLAGRTMRGQSGVYSAAMVALAAGAAGVGVLLSFWPEVRSQFRPLWTRPADAAGATGPNPIPRA